jgi:hypothetical protein
MGRKRPIITQQRLPQVNRAGKFFTNETVQLTVDLFDSGLCGALVIIHRETTGTVERRIYRPGKGYVNKVCIPGGWLYAPDEILEGVRHDASHK